MSFCFVSQLDRQGSFWMWHSICLRNLANLESKASEISLSDRTQPRKAEPPDKNVIYPHDPKGRARSLGSTKANLPSSQFSCLLKPSSLIRTFAFRVPSMENPFSGMFQRIETLMEKGFRIITDHFLITVHTNKHV